MGDVTLHPETISQAIDDMQQATTAMQNALHEFTSDVNQVLSLDAADGFVGMSQDIWTARQTQINNQIEQMNSLFGRGAPTLQYMADAIHQGDRQGAATIGGGG